MENSNAILTYAENKKSELINLLETLCRIPAPSHHEEKRAEFCKNWFEELGLSAKIDEALNVICPFGDENSDDITVFLAHTDTVFPDTDPFEPVIKDGKMHCPGVCDDTASLAVLMMTAKYLKEMSKKTSGCVLFVCNSCEEGLGNLKGIRQIMSDYGDKIKRVYSYDSCFSDIPTRCVGSYRYEVEILTEGGHSFGAFGNKNAIHYLAMMITDLYSIDVPQKEGSKTTYNVGGISGGTSVNTIAQSAKMLYEFRSDDYDSIMYMEKKFLEVVDKYKNMGIEVKVDVIGVRPCMKDVDLGAINEMYLLAKSVIEKYVDVECRENLSSTDCNIPLSMGIPAIALGIRDGAGLHTREEYLELENYHKGLAVSIDLVLNYFE